MYAASCILGLLTLPSFAAEYVDWRKFKATGVNLGGWLVQEQAIDTAWWTEYSGGALDEWGLCANLGEHCGPVLEARYSTYITTDTIDRLAEAAVEILRIPTTYAAWVKVPGSQLYSGNQTQYVKEIAIHAITKYDMHVVLDLHSLPGGVNGLTTGEALFHYGWFNNETAFGYTMQAANAVINFIQNSGHPESFTFAPINEPCDNRDLLSFSHPWCLTDNGASWILKYINAVLDRLAEINPKIPVMFQGSFVGEPYWSSNFSEDTNLVFDVHNYYFFERLTTSGNLPTFLCSDAKADAGDGKFPVFVGEWSIQAALWNTYDLRERNMNVGTWAFRNWTQGSMMWTARYLGDTGVLGQGTQKDYWSFEILAGLGPFNATQGEDYC